MNKNPPTHWMLRGLLGIASEPASDDAGGYIDVNDLELPLSDLPGQVR